MLSYRVSQAVPSADLNWIPEVRISLTRVQGRPGRRDRCDLASDEHLTFRSRRGGDDSVCA